jgi:hypothetical protein
MSRTALRIYPKATLTPPPDRGQLLDAGQVAERFFGGRVKPRWVMEHVPCKVRLGHRTVFFYEADVRAWLDQHREEVA